MNRLAKEQGGRDYRMNDLSFSHLNGATIQDEDFAVANDPTDAADDTDIVYEAMPKQVLFRFDLFCKDHGRFIAFPRKLVETPTAGRSLLCHRR